MYNLLTSRFASHKVLGAAYLVLYGRIVWLLVTHSIESYATSWFWYYPMLLHIVGFAQSMNALYTFNFLARAQKQEGFFGDKATVSKNFVKESGYFVLLCVFASAYATPIGRRKIRELVVVEPLMVFFPYQVLRRAFPRTHFNRNKDDKITRNNVSFFISTKYIASYFYLFGKHYIGNMVNYQLYLDQDTPLVRGLIFWNMLGAGYNLTIGVFLHTLKFRKILSPKAAIVTYLLGYTISGVPTLWIMLTMTDLRLWALATGGLLVNLYYPKISVFYQAFVFATLLRLKQPTVTLEALTIDGISH